MATRASLARGTAPKEVYEGRVHKWERRWLVHKKGTVKTEVMLELLRWIVTDEQCPELTGPRHPHIKPLKHPVIRQPSQKPSEQPAEQGGEKDGEQAAAEPSAPAAEQPKDLPAAPAAAGEGTAAPAAEQPPVHATAQPAEQQAAIATKQGPVPASLPPPEAPVKEAAVEDGDAFQGAGDGAAQPKPDGAAPLDGNPGEAKCTTQRHPGAQPAAEVAGEGSAAGGEGVPAPGGSQPDVPADVDMGDTAAQL